jgi:hypothetical protein
MSDQSEKDSTASGATRDMDFEQARLAYSIIKNLLEHTHVISDLIALMAQVLDEDTTKALTKTPHWNAYLESRRAMQRTRGDIEKFSAVMKTLGEEDELPSG